MSHRSRPRLPKQACKHKQLTACIGLAAFWGLLLLSVQCVMTAAGLWAVGPSSCCLVAMQEAEDAQQEADGLRTSWQCRICLSREVDSCMTACGHVLCSDCTREVRGRCPFCRKTSSIARLFK